MGQNNCQCHVILEAYEIHIGVYKFGVSTHLF
jgi:hypothetical protein